MHRCLVLLLLLSALLSAEDFVLIDDLGDDVEFQFHYYSYAGHDEFSLGRTNEGWDSSERYEIMFAVDDFWQGRSGYYGGFYIFWEEHLWERGSSYVDVNAFGAGYEMGGRFWIVAPRERPALNIAIAPYGRIGFAFQDVDFEDVPDGANAIDGAVDVERMEFMLGVDLLGRLGTRGQFTAGVGAQFWLSEQVASDINGNPLSTESFNGDSLFFRFSFGMRF